MSLTDEPTLRVVLYEGVNARPLEADERYMALTTLLEKGFAVTRVVESGQVAPHHRGSLLVLGQFPNGQPPQATDLYAEAQVRFQDISSFDGSRIAQLAENVRAEMGAAKHGDWKPWFPGY